MIKAVLMDLDGVMVEACEWHYLSLNKALMEVAGFKINEEDHETKFNGLPTKKKLEMLAAEGKVKQQDFAQIWDLKQKYTKDVIIELAKDDPVKIELHKYLKSKNIKIACVTNSITETATLMLERTGQYPFLDLLIANDQIRYPKPHGEGYIVAMVKLGVCPIEALIVEDSPKGLEAARTTGAHIWQVKNAADVTLENLLGVL